MATETKTPAPTPTPTGTLSEGAAESFVRIAAQRAKFKTAVKGLTAERDTLKTEVERLRAENAELKTKTDTSLSAQRVLELEAKIRDRDHKDAFTRIAESKGARTDAISDLWQLSGYKAEKDEIDEAAIGALIDEQRSKRAYLFGDGAGSKGAETPPPKPGVGSGQGGKSAGTPDLIADDDPRWSDVKYQYMNFDKISSAAAERVARG
jgi:hypothetical protein